MTFLFSEPRIGTALFLHSNSTRGVRRPLSHCGDENIRLVRSPGVQHIMIDQSALSVKLQDMLQENSG